jgi:hypothetical protein
MTMTMTMLWMPQPPTGPLLIATGGSSTALWTLFDLCLWIGRVQDPTRPRDPGVGEAALSSNQQPATSAFDACMDRKFLQE